MQLLRQCSMERRNIILLQMVPSLIATYIFTPQCLDGFNIKLDQCPLGYQYNPNWWLTTQDDTVVETASFITLCVSTAVVFNLVDVVVVSGSNDLMKTKC